MSIFFISNGQLFACGDNQYGQLGLNDLQNWKSFTKVPSNTFLSQSLVERIIQLLSILRVVYGHLVIMRTDFNTSV